MQHVIILPDLGQTTNEAKVLKWQKKAGDRVAKGEALLEVETDKVDTEVESFVDGYVRELLVPEGEMAVALEPLAILTDAPDEPYEKPQPAAATTEAGPGPEPGSAPAARAEPAVVAGKLAAAPAARALAKQLGIHLAEVRGSGAGGLITRKDVEAAAASSKRGGAAPAPASEELRALTAMAALTAESKRTIPHFYATRDVDVAAAAAWRDEWNAAHPELKASFNEIFARAAAQALADVPQVNTAYHNGSYESRREADILVVVAGQAGLSLVPLAAADGGSWDDYLRRLKPLIEKGPRRLLAEPGGHRRPLLAVSNLGMFGVKEFSAIIPPGCTAALAIGAVREEPVVRQGRVEVGRVCGLTLSADHRVVDGVTAARFLQRVQDFLNSLASC